ncbi:tetratricopeptide repeat protein, partial [Limnospira platensis]|uniref:tetratricopeptide repeat protein n=1 Tax=Limnospira platensis TaxID=118562 RepID=UPI0005501F93
MTNIYRFGIIGGGLCLIFYDVIWGVSQLVGDFVRGNQLLRIGKLEEAVDAYQKAIAHHPIFHWSHYKLGEALEQ